MRKLSILFLVVPLLSFAQSIKGTFSPAEDFTYAFLYKSTPDGADYVKRGQLDSIGNFEIQLDPSVTAGIYKIVYAIPPEENNFDFIYDGKETVAFNFSYENGVHFTESAENKLWNSYLKSIEMVNHTISNYYSKANSDKKGFDAIFKTLKDTQTGYEELAKGKLVYSFIKSNRPYIPTTHEDISTYSKHLKQHYLSEVDFSDVLLQSSSFLLDRVTSYVFNMVENPSNAIYSEHIDDVAAAINNDDLKIKTRLLETLWKHFADLNNYDSANYITDHYLLDLAKATNNKALEDVLIGFKNTSIGSKAPNFDITLNGNNSSLYQIEGAEHYLLVFWSSGCGHCLTQLPKLKILVSEYPNLKVIAYGLENDQESWANEIKKYPDFIHQIGLEKWNNTIAKDYNLSGTPTYFLLDASKVITSKPNSLKEIDHILKQL